METPIFLWFTIVNCIWNKWEVGECSKTCAGGKRKITRDKKIESAYGGLECSGPSNITEDCNVEQCPGAPKNFINLGVCFLARSKDVFLKFIFII